MEDDRTLITAIESYLRQIAAHYAPERHYLALIRVVFGLWVVGTARDISWVGRVPQDFVNPRPGLFSFVTSAPPETWLLGLGAAQIILGAVVAIGAFTLPASIALSVAMVTSSGFTYAFSKVDHFILFELTPIFLAFAGWGSAWSVDSFLRRRHGKHSRIVSGMPVLLFAMTISWGMLSAVVPKVAGGWLDPNRFAARGYVARDLALDEKLGPLGPQLLNIDSDLFWKFLDYSTLIAEGGLIFAAFFPLIFRIWLLLVIGFHVGVYVALGINFADNLLAYSVFFSPVAVWVADKLGAQSRDGSDPALRT